ncbi:MAG: Ig-like domain-containing protein [Treponema sp.]|nr:Ig-like domain-containing protein [Treponema sp.]
MKKNMILKISALLLSAVFVLGGGIGCSVDSDDSEKKATVAVTSVSLDKTDFQLAFGGTKPLTATVLPDNATDKTVTWTSSEPTVATVSNSGLVTALSKAGKTTITAKAGDKTASITVTVVENVTFTASTKTYSATELGLTGTSAESSSTGVATVSVSDDGTVTITSVAAGVATITVTDASGNTATAVVEVDADGSITQKSLTPYSSSDTPANTTVAVTKIEISGTTSVAKGGSVTLKATVTPSNATMKAVTWSADVTDGVTLSNGKLTVSDSCTATKISVTAAATDESGVVSDPFEVSVIDVSSVSEGITITEEKGWLETAYIKWNPATSDVIDGYNVYVKEAGGEYAKIDDMLVRAYSNTAGGSTIDYYRADALGLKAGTYQMKVVGTASGVETEQVYAESKVITVEAHDRSGFAFTGGTTPGAYKADGTLKDNAVVIYLTDDNKDSVSLEIYASSTKSKENLTGIQNILNGYAKGRESSPLVIRMIGNVTTASSADKGDLVVENKNSTNSVTFEGVGDDATANGWGLRFKNADYCEARNIGFVNCSSEEGDNIGLQQSNNYIWVHNCDMFYGNAGSDADQVKGDGALDCKKSNYVTFSYNHFWDNGKCNLLGLSEGKKSYETGAYYITYHHNWYDHSDSRHPRCRFYNAHVYNNYYDGNAKYGAGSTLGSSVFVESNYFRNCKYPMMISLQGSDIFAGSTSAQTNSKKNGGFENGTFSGESGGIIKAYNNYMTGNYTFIPYGSAKYYRNGTEVSYDLSGTTADADFDAYVANDKSEKVPESVTANKKSVALGGSFKEGEAGNYYSNFDTASTMYSYTADTPEEAKAKVESYAGRENGGDLHYTFNNSVEDTNYIVIDELKSLVTNYKSCLVKVLGTSSSSSGSGDSGSGDTGSGDTGNGDGDGDSGNTGTGGSGSTGEKVDTAAITFPTVAIPMGTYSPGSTQVTAGYFKVDSSSTVESSSISVVVGGYMSFYVDKDCALTITTGEKIGKIISEAGTTILTQSSTGESSVDLTAGKYYITCAYTSKFTKVKSFKLTEK